MSMKQQNQPHAIYLKDYTAPPFLIDQVDLTFDILATNEVHVKARLLMQRHGDSSAASTDLVLEGDGQEILSLVLDGKVLGENDYQLNGSQLIIPHVPDRFVLEQTTRIDPEINSSLMGLYASRGNLFTQCEAEGFRKIIYFLDRPDVMARYSTTIIADKSAFPVLLSNGNPVAQGQVDKQRHWVKWVDPFRKPSYLFALVAGRLSLLEDHYTTLLGRQVLLQIYAEAHDLPKCGHAMESLKNAMRWDENTYGLEYDLDRYMVVAVSDFNMGAMENKGLNIFNTKFVLVSPETATDVDFEGVESVIAHEYFHNWSGNRVTCRDWFQLSLKEGFTVFRDQEFSCDMQSRAVKRIEDVRTLRAAQFPEDAGPMAHPVRPASYIEINNFYTVTIYEKGAEVIRMLETLLGHRKFIDGAQLYFKRHDGHAVTTDDFVRAMSDASGRDLSQFQRWYDQAGTPVLTVCDRYDADRHEYTLTVAQSCPATPGQIEKLPFHIPLALGLLDEQGRDIALQLVGEEQAAGTTRVLDVTEAEQSFVFAKIANQPLPSLLRGFSAPVKLEYAYNDAQLAFLLGHDSDSFVRWDAGQTLVLNWLKSWIQATKTGQALSDANALVQAFRAVLSDQSLDPAFRALVLTLPTDTEIADQLLEIDPEAIHLARSTLLNTLASELANDWQAIYQASTIDGEYQANSQQAGLRALRRVCLSYLAASNTPEARQIVRRHFDTADNMTDQMAALIALNDSDWPERDACLDSFYTQWQNEALVVDKWFDLQAVSRRPDTPARLRLLLNHPAFNRKNPNRLRSLLGAFAHRNLRHFHALDGSGYALLADEVIAIDESNPQIASRLVSAFNRCQKLESQRQALMRIQLERIVDKPGLSGDVFEVVSRNLAVYTPH